MTAFGLAGTLAIGCSGEPERAAFQVGDSIPASWLPHTPAGESDLLVLLLFRTRDCLDCMSADYSIRRVQRRFDDVPLVALHIGDVADSAVARAFFTDRRLDAQFVTLSPEYFRREFPSAPAPAPLLVQDRVIRWTTAGPPDPDIAGVALDSLVQLLRNDAWSRQPTTAAAPSR